MKKAYIVSQSFAENRGSYSGFIEKGAKYAFSKGYLVNIICGKHNSKELTNEKLSYCEITRFELPQFPAFNNYFRALILANKLNGYFKRIIFGDEDILIANGEAALGLDFSNFILRAGDQPITIFEKNMELAGKEVPLISRLFRHIHSHLMKRIEKKYFKKALAVIYSSEETRLLYEKAYNSTKPYFIPHSGIDIRNLAQGKKIVTGKNLLFVAASRERIRKGIIYLERALPELFSRYPDVKLLHVGEKFDWNVPGWCKDKIISAGKVPWKDMRDYYASSQMLISCSLHEMFPNTIMEAMVTGLPVVTSDIQGAREYISHKKDGYIYKRTDVDGLIEGVSYVIGNAGRMGVVARKKLQNLDSQNYYDSLFSFIKDVNSGKRKHINLLN